MKKFFILKDEFFEKKLSSNLTHVISDERTLRQAINGNTISKYRPISPFKQGSIVKLRKDRGLTWNIKMTHRYCSKNVTLTTKIIGSYIDFKENYEGWTFYVDSIAEVIQY